MKMIIESTYPPVLYRLPDGRLAVAGGTITSLGSKPFTSPVVPEGTSLGDLIWLRDTKPLPDKQEYVTVQGSTPGMSYMVTYIGHRKVCTCPSYKFRRTCKHLSALP